MMFLGTYSCLQGGGGECTYVRARAMRVAIKTSAHFFGETESYFD